MKAKCVIGLFVATVMCSSVLIACHTEQESKPDFTGYQKIAELATLECYYHNVAEIFNPGTDYVFGIVNVGYKKAWLEYRGSVSLGVDVNKVAISEPDANGVVTITIPPVQVLGTPKVDKDSFSDLYADTGLVTSVTNEEKQEAISAAQANMKEDAENDAALKSQAKERAKLLLEQYVINVGESMGKDFTVRFEETPSE